MIKHIVLFRFPMTEGKEEFLKEVKAKIENLKKEISEVHSIEVGINFSKREAAYDLALYSEFKTEKDLEVYLIHPRHLKFIEFIKDSGYKVVVCDYKI